MKRMRLAVVMLCLFAVVTIFIQVNTMMQYQPTVLRLTMCDVGQGDAILIAWQSNQVLIDAGRGEKVLSCLWSELPFFDRTLELVVATHPDADHIGGLPLVFDQFSIQSLLLPPVTRETADFVALSHSVSREIELIGRVVPAKRGQKIILADELTLTVLAPLAQPGKNKLKKSLATETELSAFADFQPIPDGESNNWSIVLLLQYKHFTTLLTADAETPLELALLQAGVVDDIDVLKVGHHGSKSSTTEAFLRIISPETSLISVGKNNPYGHPTEVVLDRLRDRGVEILRTDELGSVSIESDGERYWVAR
ncbi:MAG: hypothetical protein A2632_00140 [Candidatus Pacebacteria bacterium RIFCSPHIGHO2_01_FULL_46_16]|nr:MAG: hypothetical protein A2632_00140 [Candidatus Pacebacteria bacterium RIFCSPHIGHO2_01_FULL_46_16]OGJ38782.1 MAG: hypothetical protein A3A82_03635 [Candidatus Pacebacteria bacterium RIFCSPLOWO2_01_FULL_47_12]